MKYANWVLTGGSTALPYTSLPAYAALPYLVCIPHFRWYTFLGATVFMILIKRMHSKGRNLSWLVNRLKSKMRRGIYHARPIWYVRRTSRITAPNEAIEAMLETPVPGRESKPRRTGKPPTPAAGTESTKNLKRTVKQ